MLYLNAYLILIPFHLPSLSQAKLLYFPGGTSWPKNDEVQFDIVTAPGLSPPAKASEYRSLGYFATAVAFSEEKMFRGMKQAFRDGVHYNPEIYNIASRVVTQLGLFKVRWKVLSLPTLLPPLYFSRSPLLLTFSLSYPLSSMVRCTSAGTSSSMIT